MLGHIVWYSIAGLVTRDGQGGARVTHQVRVTNDDLEAWFGELQLDPTYLPAKIAAVHAFRTASSKISAVYALPATGQTARLVVEEVKADNEQIIRHISREVTDSRRGLTAKDKVAELRYNRGRRNSAGRIAGTENWRVIIRHGVPVSDRAILDEQIAQFTDMYDVQARYRDDDDVRAVLRDYFKSLDAVAVEPSKGLYFIDQDGYGTLRSLQEFVRRIGPNCSMRIIPLVDSLENRSMLCSAFENQIEDEVRLLVKDMGRLGSGSVSPIKYGDLRNRFDYLISRRIDFLATLGDGRTECGDAALESVRPLFAALAGRIRTSSRRISRLRREGEGHVEGSTP